MLIEDNLTFPCLFAFCLGMIWELIFN